MYPEPRSLIRIVSRVSVKRYIPESQAVTRLPSCEREWVADTHNTFVSLTRLDHFNPALLNSQNYRSVKDPTGAYLEDARWVSKWGALRENICDLEHRPGGMDSRLVSKWFKRNETIKKRFRTSDKDKLLAQRRFVRGKLWALELHRCSVWTRSVTGFED